MLLRDALRGVIRKVLSECGNGYICRVITISSFHLPDQSARRAESRPRFKER